MAFKERNSNLELFRIITMILIVAHHYVVNSDLFTMVNTLGKINFNSLFLILFGWGGKTGINFFVLITGYFMCTSSITLKKYMKLFLERDFYCVLFFIIFLITGYTTFSIKGAISTIFPFFVVQDNFTGCFLLFYLFIPFLNQFIHTMHEKEHFLFIGLLLFIYTFLPTFMNSVVAFNYVTWFIVLYFIASYIRLYDKKWFSNTKLWAILTIITLLLSWVSVVGLYVLGYRGTEYFFVSDSNKVLALLTAVCAFMFFKNVHIPQNTWINKISSSSFGVLLIHANCDAMRQWLWKDTLKNVLLFDSRFLIVHAVLSVIMIYVVCTIIDQIRIRYIEKPMFRRYL